MSQEEMDGRAARKFLELSKLIKQRAVLRSEIEQTAKSLQSTADRAMSALKAASRETSSDERAVANYWHRQFENIPDSPIKTIRESCIKLSVAESGIARLKQELSQMGHDLKNFCE